MEASVYKWLGFSLMASLLYMKSSNLQSFPESLHWGGGIPHPFHVSTTEINHNAKNKTLEISCRIFTDDFEAILEKNYKTKVDLTHPPAANKAAIDKIVNDYVAKHLQLKADSKLVTLSYLGYEIDNDAVAVYLEVDNIPSVKKVETTDSILYDQFNDQMSIIHVIVGGNRKSTKLDYPDTNASFEF